MLAPGALPRLKSAKINLLLVDSFAHVDFFLGGGEGRLEQPQILLRYY